MGVRMALAAAAIAVSAAGGANAQMEEWARWQVVDGVATIQNDAAAFGVTCGEAGSPALTLAAPDAAAIPDSATVLIQVSSRSDAYVLEEGTDIETFLRHFRPAAGGGYVSDEGPVEPLVDSLRANVLRTVLTTLGMVFSFLLGANVLVEKVFSWPGIGSFAIEALVASDYAAVQGFVLSMALLFVAVNLAIDLVLTLVDPRVGLDD